LLESEFFHNTQNTDKSYRDLSVFWFERGVEIGFEFTLRDPSVTEGRDAFIIATRMPWFDPECTTRILWRVRVRVRVRERCASAEIEFIRIVLDPDWHTMLGMLPKSHDVARRSQHGAGERSGFGSAPPP